MGRLAAAAAPLVGANSAPAGPGAGAGASPAITALTEAAAKRTAQAIFFISMVAVLVIVF